MHAKRQEVVKAVSMQKDRFEMTKSPHLKAIECADLLLLSLYVQLPPCRAKEIRTLEIVPEKASLADPSFTGRNVLQSCNDGSFKIRYGNYKTVDTYGPNTTHLEVSQVTISMNIIL